MRFAQLIGLGAACGFAPAAVGAMSLWEFNAAVAGYLRAHAAQGDGELTTDEEAALGRLLDEHEGSRYVH